MAQITLASAPDPAPSASRIFAIVIAVTFAVRLVLLIVLHGSPYTADAQDYTHMGLQLLAGEHFVPYWPPGLPLFLVPFLSFSTALSTLRAAMLLWWVLACWGIWRLAADLGVSRYAWVVLLVFGLSPAALELSVEPLTQLPVAALFIVSLSATIRLAREGGCRNALLLGAACAYMGLVRPSAMPLSLVLPAAAAYRRRSLSTVVLPVLVAGASVAAWLAYSHHICGHWILNTANAQNAWNGNNPWTPLYRTWFFGSHAKPGSPELDQFPGFKAQVMAGDALPALAQPAYFHHLAFTYVTQHPLLFLLRTFNRICCFFAFDTFTSLALRPFSKVLFGLSLLLEAAAFLALMAPAWWRIAGASRTFWRRRAMWLVLGGSALYAMPYWVSMSHPTYHVPVVVPIALAGFGAIEAAEPGRRRVQTLTLLALAVIQVQWIAVMAYSTKG